MTILYDKNNIITLIDRTLQNQTTNLFELLKIYRPQRFMKRRK